jgi:hypothetical protein
VELLGQFQCLVDAGEAVGQVLGSDAGHGLNYKVNN